MMKLNRILLVCGIVIALGAGCAMAEEDAAFKPDIKGKEMVGIKLAFEKEFNSDITAVAVSSDGSKIAVGIAPLCKWYDKDGGIATEELDTNVIRCTTTGKLIYFDNFKQVWEQKFSTTTLVSELHMSTDGQKLFCQIDKPFAKEHITVEMGGIVKRVTMNVKALMFDKSGEVLWSKKGEALFLSEDGSFAVTRDKYYRFFENGKEIWKKTVVNRIVEDEIVGDYEVPLNAQLSKDGSFFIMGNKVYDKHGELLSKGENIVFVSDKVALVKNNKCFYLKDLLTGAISWVKADDIISEAEKKTCNYSGLLDLRIPGHLSGPIILVVDKYFLNLGTALYIHDVKFGKFLKKIDMGPYNPYIWKSSVVESKLICIVSYEPKGVFVLELPTLKYLSFLPIPKRNGVSVSGIINQGVTVASEWNSVVFSSKYAVVFSGNILKVYDYNELKN